MPCWPRPGARSRPADPVSYPPMVTDDMLRRDTRPPEALTRALTARLVIRLARLQGFGSHRRLGDALEAIRAGRAAALTKQELALGE